MYSNKVYTNFRIMQKTIHKTNRADTMSALTNILLPLPEYYLELDTLHNSPIKLVSSIEYIVSS